jgi:hypothetical protein
LNIEDAHAFAADWLAGWNARDLEAILRPYAPDVVFRSPLIATVTGRRSCVVHGLDELRSYWSAALAQAPDLCFEIDRVYVGHNTVTIAYRNQRRESVAETLVFNDAGQIVEGIVAHAPAGPAMSH